MARDTIWLKPFCRDDDFVVIRPIEISGRTIQRGEAFDKSTVSTRTLRQLYEQRRLAVAVQPREEGDTAPADPVPPPVIPMPPLPLVVKHVGRGRYAIMRGTERVVDQMTKAEAEECLAKMAA